MVGELLSLHEIIQLAVGWTDVHLRFCVFHTSCPVVALRGDDDVVVDAGVDDPVARTRNAISIAGSAVGFAASYSARPPTRGPRPWPPRRPLPPAARSR